MKKNNSSPYVESKSSGGGIGAGPYVLVKKDLTLETQIAECTKIMAKAIVTQCHLIGDGLPEIIHGVQGNAKVFHANGNPFVRLADGSTIDL